MQISSRLTTRREVTTIETISPVFYIKEAKMKFVLILAFVACAAVFVNSLEESQYDTNNPLVSLNRELLQVDSEIHSDSAVEAPGEHGVRNKRQFFGGGYGGYGGYGRRRFGGYGGYGGGFRRRGYGGYGFYG